jgi:hypothetical protein
MLVAMNADIAHIEIEVRVEGEAISGEARGDAGRPRPFTGWLGLIGALDDLLCDTAGLRPGVAPPNPGPQGDRT